MFHSSISHHNIMVQKRFAPLSFDAFHLVTARYLTRLSASILCVRMIEIIEFKVGGL